MAGLEVTIKRSSIGQVLDDQRREIAAKASDDGAAWISLRCEIVGRQLVGWNLEDEDGTPVAATLEGVLSQDMELVTAILVAANSTIYGVSAPLDESSTSGETFPEASLPMEPLSPSPSSSPMLVSS
jgi:hypothetical protein